MIKVLTQLYHTFDDTHWSICEQQTQNHMVHQEKQVWTTSPKHTKFEFELMTRIIAVNYDKP